ncbi:MAG: outer membrane beta-barrel protein [Bacteroidaceae bacterium]|nr:outer membrane beta-barrel protein [Bacteroidaceae bacterium]
MKKLLFWLCMSMMVTVSAVAQTRNITVKGKVTDKDSGDPVVQATVQLMTMPDSTYVNGAATLDDGSFELPKVAAGKYLMKVSFIGYKNIFHNLTLTNQRTTVDVGNQKMELDAIALREAIVTAMASQVQVVEDTLLYNANAYRTPEGAMLEELVKKLPGAEVDDSGNIKINGKDIKKLMVNGKEFFGGDVQTGLKNLPVDMVENLKTYDRQSDMARVTGIEDGEEETVLDLTVKKNMNQGLFGNVDLGIGTEKRYTSRGMMNYFNGSTQLTFMGGANNVNDQGFSGGGGGGGFRFGRNNGLTATKTFGMSFATETDKLELGGSIRYNWRDNDVVNLGSQENFLFDGGSSFMNSNSMNRNKNNQWNANMRIEWKPTKMTNILFRPTVSWGKTNNGSDSESGTFGSDPYQVVDDPNEYLSFDILDDSDPLKAIRRNLTESANMTKQNSLSVNSSLQINQKLNDAGRNITFRGQFRYGDNDNDQYTQSLTRYYQLVSVLGGDSTLIRNQFITTPAKNTTYSAQVTYSEPIAKNTFLQFSYEFQYGLNKNDRKTYNLNDFPWTLGNSLPIGYQTAEVDSLSKYAEYRTYSHEGSVTLRFNREKYQLSAGINLEPQHTVLSYKRADYMIDTTRNVFNFAPNVDFRYRFSKVSQLRFQYRGRSSQPSMENLLPISDYSNPLNVRVGNPGLKPSFTHTVTLFYNTYDAERQRGISANAFFNASQNSVSNSRIYNEKTGGWTTMPKNINGNWNINGMFNYNTALKNQKYTINTFTQVGYTNNVGYLTDNKTHIEQKNTTTNLTLGERVNGAYRNDWFEFGINGAINYSIERNKLNTQNNQEPYTYSYGANTQIILPWNMTISTNITNQARRGYSDKSMNRDELIWNAQISQTLFKGAASLSVEAYDILKKQSTIMRSLSANGRSVNQYNAINSYVMVHFIYRLNIFGGRNARDQRRGPDGPGGFQGPPPGGGGFGGGRPGGGFGGGRRPVE